MHTHVVLCVPARCTQGSLRVCLLGVRGRRPLRAGLRTVKAAGKPASVHVAIVICSLFRTTSVIRTSSFYGCGTWTADLGGELGSGQPFLPAGPPKGHLPTPREPHVHSRIPPEVLPQGLTELGDALLHTAGSRAKHAASPHSWFVDTVQSCPAPTVIPSRLHSGLSSGQSGQTGSGILVHS